jgi:tetratricopeptide (TPR) repeat protein
MKLTLLTVCMSSICFFTCVTARAQDFHITEVSDNVFIVADSEAGESQLVVQSENGLVVFNTFWSETTATRFRDEIASTLERSDFSHTVNMIDRLDYFGGNAAYSETQIIGHRTFVDMYEGKDDQVAAEIQELIDMWRRKEDYARESLEEMEEGSEAAAKRLRWVNTCKKRADELESSFSLVLPTVAYDDRTTVDLGNLTLELIWFGKAGSKNGMSVAVIPEERIAVIPSFILHTHHLAPYPFYEYAELDVPRWIAVLEEVLEGNNAVEKVVCDINQVWSRDRAHTHLNYIRTLWKEVQTARAEGLSLQQTQAKYSLDSACSFVKEMESYRVMGDEWIRPQHRDHVRQFYLQGMTLATAIIRDGGDDEVLESVSKVSEMISNGAEIYVGERDINTLGYYYLGRELFEQAIAVFKLNVEVHPESANTYDSLAEAFMKSGDRDNAIKNYRKSLELNPENTNATQMLEQLVG